MSSVNPHWHVHCPDPAGVCPDCWVPGTSEAAEQARQRRERLSTGGIFRGVGEYSRQVGENSSSTPMTWTWDYEESGEGYYQIYGDSDYIVTIAGPRSPEADNIAAALVAALNGMEDDDD